MKLNIPNKNDQFDNVSFVHNMTMFQLKVLVKRLWENFQDLATACQDKHKDVATVVDQILDGKNWNPKQLDDRYMYAHYKGYTLRFDSLTKKFMILDENYEPAGGEVQGYTMKEIRELIKERKAA